MADWVNKGSYQDLSNAILPGDPVSALTPTSQAGGNMLASNEQAMTAPGSEPVDNLNHHMDQVRIDPALQASNAGAIEPADDGKPQARTDTTPSPATRWVATTVPDVKRRPMTSRRDSGPGVI